ncbi:probable leucine-rich repeat receptor-like protein kinase At1g35710 [Pyrus communis]|uniref:probable leucine-rich repeat receptor-like protein kinase At1g35710 n=1 Tax=Pyrus communis TaxID=23211 RepID=UPI0035C150BA
MTSLDFHKLCLLAYCLVLFVQLLSPRSCSAFASATSSTKAEALLKWKATFQNHTRLQNLTSRAYLPTHAKAAPCFWTGISCNVVGSVSVINLTNFGIQGTLHEFSFLSFPNLQYLNLNYNNLFDVIPAKISSLFKLISLDLSNNWLSGSIPTSLGQLTNLSTLYLFRNNLFGTIPKEIGNLKSLVDLEFIPKEIGNLKSLVDLELSYNKLIGLIPTSLGQLINLSTLYLGSNNLSGTIPKEIGNLKSLRNLSLYKNQLSGSIPTSLGQLTNLSTLYLYSNNLSGTIPKEIGNLKLWTW